jgi:hypothetical protein
VTSLVTARSVTIQGAKASSLITLNGCPKEAAAPASPAECACSDVKVRDLDDSVEARTL